MMLKRSLLVPALCLALLLPVVGHAERHEDERGGREHQHYDVRHGHNHYYPDRGMVVPVVPRAAAVVRFGDGRFWFHEGVWYRPEGRRFVVIAPPLGVLIPVLPPFATLVLFGGAQFYYANEAYYRYREDLREYEVVEPPEAAPDTPPAPGYDGRPPAPPPTDDVFVYPKNGQSQEQQSRDRYECHRWAADQTGFDPTRPGGGVPPGAAGAKRGDYRRAQQACLEARGYTVR